MAWSVAVACALLLEPIFIYNNFSPGSSFIVKFFLMFFYLLFLHSFY